MAVGKLMILEDEEILGNLYKKKLEGVGYDVTLFETVNDAENWLKDNDPDIILVDHGIKADQKTGLDLIKFAKANKPSAKAVMLSNYSHSELKDEVLAAGADDFWIKLNTPPKVLIQRVDQLVD